MYNKLQLHEEDEMLLKSPRIVNPCYTFSHLDQNKFPTMEKWRKQPRHEGKCTGALKRMREKNRWMKNGMGMHFQAFTFPRSQKNVFEKWVASQI